MNGKKHIKQFSSVLLAGALLVGLMLTGCAANTYQVDYNGQKDLYEGARDSYRAGETVTLYYPYIATDTDYSFTLDGEPVKMEYDEQKGIVLSFVMPDHDVSLDYQTTESMEYVPDTEPDVLLFDYYYEAQTAGEGAGGYYEITLSTTVNPDCLFLDEYTKASAESETINVRYIVPYDALNECMQVVEDYDFYSWNTREDTASIDGTLTVCQFPDGNELMRVSTEAIPEDGHAALDRLCEILTGYMTEEYRIWE